MTTSRPLAGVRITDLSRVLSGPYATMLLADLGADVIKVEHPGHGDDTRAWGPPFAGGESAYYLSLNRGKRDLAIDLTDTEGARIAADLCVRGDVVVQNFRPGVADRLGLGYRAIAARNPAVVYCSITGFGARREPADRPGFDAVLQAESGFMHITGPADGPPSKVGVAITDVLTALNAATAITAALYRRAQTGAGSHVEVSMLDSALSGLVNVAQSALVSGAEAVRHGNAHPSVVPYETFHAADGMVTVAAGNDALFGRLCTAIGRPGLADDPRFRHNPDRIANRDALLAELQPELARRTADEWVAELMAAGVPVGKIRGVRDALAAAAAAGEPATFTVDHPTAGPLELVGPGFGTRSEPAGALPPPLLGQHSRQILTELGIGPGRIDDLAERGVITQADRSDDIDGVTT